MAIHQTCYSKEEFTQGSDIIKSDIKQARVLHQEYKKRKREASLDGNDQTRKKRKKGR